MDMNLIKYGEIIRFFSNKLNEKSSEKCYKSRGDAILTGTPVRRAVRGKIKKGRPGKGTALALWECFYTNMVTGFSR
jgi:hypothetical protein